MRERLAEVLFLSFGMDDWGVANDDERAEWLSAADTVIAALPKFGLELLFNEAMKNE